MPSKQKNAAKNAKPVKKITYEKSTDKIKLRTDKQKITTQPNRKTNNKVVSDSDRNLKDTAYLTQRADQIFEILSKDELPETIALEYEDHYTLLVSTILSAQSTDVQVNKITPALFAVASTPQQIAELGVDQLIEYIKSIGLFRSKAKNIIATSKMLIERFNSTVPNNIDDLLQLPGVGRKTANVVLNFGFRKPTFPVDTHVFRLANRLEISNGKTPDQVEQDLEKYVPEKWALEAHNFLVWHGRNVCKARKPECTKCSLSKICNSKDKVI
ncbi:endonuclease III [Candidatus Cytomitobacter primus]|uniref:Endonuclease III n=1 Tax=Candidatus Cytomitobacter primus TaxID=2066024 RepID=A0A5C0UGB2_9PROT|nr:endonuclease III [Candidatus Cytomitobacter primus]QEK38322.1 endonuclease III [Candidatus Cytomitobacter primus]